jgi:hypothetical protein
MIELKMPKLKSGIDVELLPEDTLMAWTGMCTIEKISIIWINLKTFTIKSDVVNQVTISMPKLENFEQNIYVSEKLEDQNKVLQAISDECYPCKPCLVEVFINNQNQMLFVNIPVSELIRTKLMKEEQVNG